MYQFIVGGLGNQLFQFAMFHYILSETDETEGSLWIDKNPRQDRPYLLAELTGICRHVDRTNAPYEGLKGKASIVLNKIPESRLTKNFKVIEQREVKEFTFISNPDELLGKNKFWIGYYQHFRYVENSWPTFGSELCTFVESIKGVPHLPDLYTVIHIRGGDFYNLKARHGVLNLDYFKRALSLVDSRFKETVIVITDDIESTKKFCIELRPSLVFGPEDINEWESLKMMSNAACVITANSTFSWWGGRLALEHGAKVFIPSPWFKQDSVGVKNAFEHPKFLRVRSSFLR